MNEARECAQETWKMGMQEASKKERGLETSHAEHLKIWETENKTAGVLKQMAVQVCWVIQSGDHWSTVKKTMIQQ